MKRTMSKPDQDYENIWSRFILQLKNHQPFLASLALFTDFRVDEHIDFAETRDKSIYIAPEFFSTLNQQQQYSFLLHQVLHLALGHPFRVEQRNIDLWNIAADIVVNNIISECTPLPPAPKTAWDKRFAGQSAERVYAALYGVIQKQNEQQGNGGEDGRSGKSDTIQSSGSLSVNGDDSLEKTEDGSINQSISSSENINSNSQSPTTHGAKGLQQLYHCECDFRDGSGHKGNASKAYWRNAMTITKTNQDEINQHAGKDSDTLEREFEFITGENINWRELLWKYAAPATNDFTEFDQRFIHRQLYLETLLAEQLRVDVVIDTSASITDEILNRFVSEVLAIHRCHPDVILSLYYLDVVLHGPYPIVNVLKDFPTPIGLGGTDFTGYFKHIKSNSSLTEGPVAVVFFTDGFGEFPNQIPEHDVLWIVTENGANNKDFPFGKVVRIH